MRIEELRDEPEHDGRPARVTAGDYAYNGVIAGAIKKSSGVIRLAVEDPNGRLYFHNMEQTRLLGNHEEDYSMMSFNEAIRMARDAGKRVRSRSWPNNDSLIFIEALTDLHASGLYVVEGDTLAIVPFFNLASEGSNDWEVVRRKAPDHPDFADSDRDIPVERIVPYDPPIPGNPHHEVDHHLDHATDAPAASGGGDTGGGSSAD